MNNKGQTALALIMSLVIVLGFAAVLFFAMVGQMQWNEECEFKSINKLKGWNGISDKDTGLLSSGSVNKDSLIFENGAIYSFTSWDRRNMPRDIVIGDYYIISDCKAFQNGGYVKIEKTSQTHNKEQEE